MKKTYNINLDGRIFTIDDDAYRLLDDYLETLKHAFSGTDNNEIVTDIEARISEILFIEQEEGRQVVTLKDIEAVITRIGHPEEMIEEADVVIESGRQGDTIIEETVSQTLPPPIPTAPPTIKKRLYRDTSHGMIGGVCAGLAEYLNVDVTWVRLITVALCFVSVSTLAVAYVILWIVLPDAQTPLQRMQLTGESPTLQNIGQSVKSFFNNRNQADMPGNQEIYAMPQNANGGEKRFIDGLAGFFGILAKILLVFALIIFLPVEIALAIGLIGCILAALIFATASGASLFTNVPWIEVGGEPTSMIITALLCAIGYIILLGIPLFFLIRLIIGKRTNPLSRSTRIAAIVAWIIAFILAGVTTGLFILSEEYPGMVFPV